MTDTTADTDLLATVTTGLASGCAMEVRPAYDHDGRPFTPQRWEVTVVRRRAVDHAVVAP